jgi:probable addiction module antidote protein
VVSVEAETNMSQLNGVVSHHEREIAELRADRELAVAYLKAAMESLDDPDERAAGLLALRTVAEAHGGLGAVAAEAGISRESLYRSLSPKGNPTLKTLLAVLKTVGMRLSVEPEHQAHA